MTRPIPHTSQNDAEADETLEVLLTGDRADSIVDSLFALPDEEDLRRATGELGSAVHGRLQARLAERLRRAIEADERAQSAA